MTDRKSSLWIAVAGVCLWPGLAAAQMQDPQAFLGFTGEIEAGVGYNTEDSFKFGEYSGLEDEEAFAIGAIDAQRRAPYNGDSTEYWGIAGTNLGLDSRSVHLEYGRQGRYDLFFEYDQIPRHQIEGARTPYSGEGTGRLTLPAGLQNSSTTTAGIPGLQSNLRSIDIETERKDLGGGITWHLSPEWSVKGTYEHNMKEGTDTIAGVIFRTGGNPRSAILPQPIDYEEDRVDIGVSYKSERLQAELGYSGSWFTNNDSALRWDNPFTNTAWDGASQPPEGQLALPPDNQAHRISLSGGYSLGETTRLNGTVSYGWMLQDQDFLPYTINPNLTLIDPNPPRPSLDGEINNLLVDLSASTRPMPRLDLRARYRYDDRDNNTPRDTYFVVTGDARHQDAVTAGAGLQRINLPYSSTQNLVNLDASYLLLAESNTKLSVGYDFEQKERTFSEVETTRDHTGRVKIQSAPVSYLSGSVKYAHTIRDGSDYVGNAPLLAGHVGAAPDEFENHPDLRKFYLADRDGDTVAASLTFLPHDRVTIGLSGSHTMYNYDDGLYGLRDHDLSDVTVDVSYSPMDNVTAYAFFTHERQNFEQDAIAFSGTAGGQALALTNPPDQLWSADTHDRVNTLGARLEWNAIAKLLDVSLEYSFSKAITSFDLASGGTPDTTPLPDLTSRLHSLGVNANYHLRENMTVRFGYRFETLSTDDFALDGVDVDTMSDVLSLGESSPNYTAHVIGVSLAFKF